MSARVFRFLRIAPFPSGRGNPVQIFAQSNISRSERAITPAPLGSHEIQTRPRRINDLQRSILKGSDTINPTTAPNQRFAKLGAAFGTKIGGIFTSGGERPAQ